MKTLFLLIFTSFLFGDFFAQSIPYTSVGRGVATTFETDYHCLGINPSALGWGTGYAGKRFLISTSETTSSMFSDSLDKRKFNNFYKIIKTQINNKTLDPSSSQSILDGAGALAKAGVRVNIESLWFGGSFQTSKFGGIAFSISESYGFATKINDNSANILFQGQWENLIDSVTVSINGVDTRVAYNTNMSSDSLAAISSAHFSAPFNINSFTYGNSAQLIWNRNFNFGYGRKIIGNDSTFAIYGGIGFRYVQAMSYYDMRSDDDGLNVSSSLTTEQLNSGGILSQINPMNAGSFGGLFAKPVGGGYGLDFSASIIIKAKLRLAAAVNNIGAVNYKRYKYTGNPNISQEIPIENGFNPINPVKTVQELMRGSEFLISNGEENFKVENAANLRLGASWIPIKQVHIGIDMVAPFNKENATSIQNPIFAIGIDFRPAKWISLNTGIVSGGVYSGNIPAGINFIVGNGSYEFGIASRDLIHFLTKNGNSVSSAFGFARVRF